MIQLFALGEVATINPDTSIPFCADDLCSFVPMDAIDEATAEINRLATRPYKDVAKGYTSLRENDVLLAKITPCMENGKCAIARGLRNGIGFGSTEFHFVRVSHHILPEWIYFYWRFPRTRALAERSMTGTAGQKRVPTSFLELLPIPTPSIDKQRDLTRLLQKADELCRMRRYAVELSDVVLPATFLELFGNHFNKGASRPLGELVKITGGGTPSRDRPEFFQGRIPWLTAKDMRGDYIWDTEEHITEDAIENSATNLVPANSILVVVKSKVLMHRLPVAIAKVPMCHGQDIKSIQCLEGLHHEFARFVLKHHEGHLLNIARGANTEGLTLPMLEGLPVPKVEFSEQRQFAALVARHEQLRATHVEALRQAEHLFQTLLQQVFSPEQAASAWEQEKAPRVAGLERT